MTVPLNEQNLVEQRYEAYAGSGAIARRGDRDEIWIFDPQVCRSAFESSRLSSKRSVLADRAESTGHVALAEFFRCWLMYTEGAIHVRRRREVIRTIRPSLAKKDRFIPSPLKRASPGQTDLITNYCEPFVWEMLSWYFGLSEHEVAFWRPRIHCLVALPGIAEPTIRQLGEAERCLVDLRAYIKRHPIGTLLKGNGPETDEAAAIDIVINVVGDGIHPTVSALATEIWLRLDRCSTTPLDNEWCMFHEEAPFQYAARTALSNMILAGEHVSAGDRVVLCIGGANRRLLQTGHTQRLLTFGHGRHSCPGRRLAEECVRVGTSAFFRTYGGAVEISESPQWIRSIGYRAISRLSLRYKE